MEYAPNHLDAKAVEPIVEVVVTNPLEPEIDSEFLSAFGPMDVDTIFNPADVDLDVKSMDEDDVSFVDGVLEGALGALDDET
ncbi:hypothetical protein Tco_0151324 [Tanacetum coccineum]